MTPNIPAPQHWTEAQLDEALRQLRADVVVSASSVDSARTAFDRAIQGEEKPAGFSRPRRRRLGYAVALAAAAATVLGLVWTGTQGGGSDHRAATPPERMVQATQPSSAAVSPQLAAYARSLLSTSAAAITASPIVVPAGKYLKVVQHAWWPASTGGRDGKLYEYLTENHLASWIPADTTGIWQSERSQAATIKWLNSTPEAASAAGVTPPAPTASGHHSAACGGYYAPTPADACAQGSWATWGSPTSTWIASLPRDPSALWQILVKDAGQTKWGPAGAFNLALEALNTGVIPADLSAAIYRALAGNLPELSYAENVPNADGVIGDAIGLYSPAVNPVRFELIIDPATGQFLGERDTVVADTGAPDYLKAGTVTSWTAIQTGVTAAPPA